jgi:cell division protein ZapA (FtsZ GTPase activity inhibitor)
MEKLSLKVVIAGRTYPLTVVEGEQEKVLKAAEDINKAVQLLKDNYAVKDMQDLLAMTALQLAAKPNTQGETVTKEADYTGIEQSLEGLLRELDELK